MVSGDFQFEGFQFTSMLIKKDRHMHRIIVQSPSNIKYIINKDLRCILFICKPSVNSAY